MNQETLRLETARVGVTFLFSFPVSFLEAEIDEEEERTASGRMECLRGRRGDTVKAGPA